MCDGEESPSPLWPRHPWHQHRPNRPVPGPKPVMPLVRARHSTYKLQIKVQVKQHWRNPGTRFRYCCRERRNDSVASGRAQRTGVDPRDGQAHLELWVPAEDLDEFNRHIQGEIRIVAEYRDGERVV